MLRAQSPKAPPSSPRPPELPRDTVDTRMPLTPAPGGKVIKVGQPGRSSPRRADLDGGVLAGALLTAAVGVAAWRLLRSRGARQRLL